MSETDEEFLNWLRPRVGATSPQNLDRLFALARRGAEAAAEIERLRAALREISDCKTFTDRKYMIDIARTALKEDGDA